VKAATKALKSSYLEQEMIMAECEHGISWPYACADCDSEQQEFEVMNPVMEDGWSEWIHPLPGYLMKCCDCGLVHEMQVAIGQREGNGPLNGGESSEGVVLFRMRRTHG
jgi:hypothetical protein